MKTKSYRRALLALLTAVVIATGVATQAHTVIAAGGAEEVVETTDPQKPP